MRIHSCSRARSSDSWAGRRRSTPVDGLSMPMGGGAFHDDRRLAALGALRALQVQLDQVATLQLRWRVTSDSPARCPRAPCPLLIWFSTSQRIVGYQQPLCSPPRPVRAALCSPTPSPGNTLAMSGSRTTMLAPPQTSAGRTSRGLPPSRTLAELVTSCFVRFLLHSPARRLSSAELSDFRCLRPKSGCELRSSRYRVWDGFRLWTA